MIRLYEHKAGSFKTVSEGMERGILLNGKLAGVCRNEDDGFGEQQGVLAPTAICVGSMDRVYRPHLRGKHNKVLLLLAPNSEGVPPEVVEQLLDNTYSVYAEGSRPMIDGLLAPSRWALSVLQKAFPSLPVSLWQHGVLPEYVLNEKLRLEVGKSRTRDEFQLLHVTSTNKARKGTVELIEAWERFRADRPGMKCRLDILVNPTFLLEMTALVRGMKAPSVCVAAGGGYSALQMALGFSTYHGLIQPSRAEGFGLVPLEALACGVPVAMTTCTGHADFADNPGVVPIESGPSAPSDDYHGATAPSVTVEAIYTSLCQLYDNWWDVNKAARENADALRAHWSWEARAAEGLSDLEKKHGHE